ncbi:MAG TPA: hypothetical protein VG055_31760 [Planctomycetaceae bacterium]|jgi:hypothetical protein|nr:hypothetical protein [Planctomycetaceae bacterium]
MKDKPPPKEQTPFERFREMTQRLLQVDKKDLPKAKQKPKTRKNMRGRGS